jgi:glycine/D-amino acid oxidase-like deaminating enzyme
MVSQRIAVLGAGLQGACIALELAARGARVDLVDQDPVALNRASLRNEGKIHLGLVYAQAPTLDTAGRMLRGALAFRALLARWTGDALRLRTSTRFQYLVPHDSLRSLEQLASHYDAVQRLYEDERARLRADYLGETPARLWRPLVPAEYAHAAGDRLQGGCATVEAAIDLPPKAASLRAVLAEHPRIAAHMGCVVEGVARTAAGFRVSGAARDGTAWALDCDQVVNALWDGRLAVDATLGSRRSAPGCIASSTGCSSTCRRRSAACRR